jgi:hypothetical protein
MRKMREGELPGRDPGAVEAPGQRNHMYGPRLGRTLLAAALGVAASATGVLAQDDDRHASRFDLAAYGGWSWTSDWVEVRDVGFGIGDNPIVGAYAAWFPTKRVGVRLHGAYIPSRYPVSENEELNEVLPIPEGRALNTWLYDLDLVLRPWAGRPDALGGAYLFVGGGGLTTNPAGGDGECVAPYYTANACLSSEATTVGQGTVGAGITLLRITRALGVFGEAAVHVYDSPFTLGAEQFVPNPDCPLECLADDRLAVTTRLVGGLVLAVGRRPAAPAPPLVVVPPVIVAPPREEAMRICVQEEGIPRWTEATYLPETGDTVVVGANGVRRPFRAVYPDVGTSASSRPWFINSENVFHRGREYVRYGLPQAVEPAELVRQGEYDGVPLFTRVGAGTAPGSADAPGQLLFPVQPECVFQIYVPREMPVRG